MEPSPIIRVEEKEPSQPAASGHVHRDWLCTAIGLLVFLGGIALLVVTFRLAFSIFETPPSTAIGAVKGKTIDLAAAGSSVVSLLIKIVLLALMAVVGSMVANRGISLYSHAKTKT